MEKTRTEFEFGQGPDKKRIFANCNVTIHQFEIPESQNRKKNDEHQNAIFVVLLIVFCRFRSAEVQLGSIRPFLVHTKRTTSTMSSFVKMLQNANDEMKERPNEMTTKKKYTRNNLFGY